MNNKELSRAVAEMMGVKFSDGAVTKDFFWKWNEHQGSNFDITQPAEQMAFVEWFLKDDARNRILWVWAVKTLPSKQWY